MSNPNHLNQINVAASLQAKRLVLDENPQLRLARALTQLGFIVIIAYFIYFLIDLYAVDPQNPSFYAFLGLGGIVLVFINWNDIQGKPRSYPLNKMQAKDQKTNMQVVHGILENLGYEVTEKSENHIVAAPVDERDQFYDLNFLFEKEEIYYYLYEEPKNYFFRILPAWYYFRQGVFDRNTVYRQLVRHLKEKLD